MQIFAGVREIWGVKQESGRLRCQFSYLSLAIFSESSSSRLKSATHSICVKLLHRPKHDKLTQCCRAFTLALARLSCFELLHTFSRTLVMTGSVVSDSVVCHSVWVHVACRVKWRSRTVCWSWRTVCCSWRTVCQRSRTVCRTWRPARMRTSSSVTSHPTRRS